MRRYEVCREIAQNGSVAIVRAATAEIGSAQCTALLEAGQRVLEVSMTTPGALDIIAALRGQFSEEDAVIGVGTVLDATTVRLAHLAGAQFVVAPTLSTEVLVASHRYGLATLPGVGSPTEALRAVEAGADFAKLFPASAYGPGSVRDFLAACPQVALVPTGGVTLANAPDYIRAGAVAVGIGSALTSGPTEALAQRVVELRDAIAQARS